MVATFFLQMCIRDRYTVVLNKADSASKREAALEVCRELNVRGVENIVVTSLHSKKL